MRWLQKKLLISKKQVIFLLFIGIVSSLGTYTATKHYGITASDIQETVSSFRLPQVDISRFLPERIPADPPVGSVSHIPFDSFVAVMLDSNIIPKACMMNDFYVEECYTPGPIRVSSKGSGVVVGHGLGVSYVMTAAHVCQHMERQAVMIDGMAYEYDHYSETSVVDFTGRIRPATIMDIDEINDLCLMMVRDVWAEAVPVSDDMPMRGERVFNMAAPLGIFSPGMVLTFDGMYAGKDMYDDNFFTIPAWPGSSGSPILNSDGEMVGIIHSATPVFPNIALATPLDVINEMMSENEELFR